jgi:ERCC4-related helicase
LDDTRGTSLALSYLKDICSLNNIPFGFVEPQHEEQLQRPSKPCKGSPAETQLSKFCTKAIHIYNELGKWATDYFIFESISVLVKPNEVGDYQLREIVERESLLRILDPKHPLLLRQNQAFTGDLVVSSKVAKLISFLENQDFENTSGILFAQQRVVVSILCKLLSIHPKIKGRFQCATFVGMSNNTAKKYGMTELLDLKTQRETLASFRARKKNLIIATDVLEEGIDIPACNLVFCFDPPAHVKSFIQRRGRARQENSQFAIMFPKGKGVSQIDHWQGLEATLIEKYQTEQRQIRNRRSLEDDDVEVVPGKLFVESTQ